MFKKIFSFVATNASRIHDLNDKIQTAYGWWQTIYGQIKQLVPGAPAAPALPVQEDPAYTPGAAPATPYVGPVAPLPDAAYEPAPQA